MHLVFRKVIGSSVWGGISVTSFLQPQEASVKEPDVDGCFLVEKMNTRVSRLPKVPFADFGRHSLARQRWGFTRIFNFWGEFDGTTVSGGVPEVAIFVIVVSCSA